MAGIAESLRRDLSAPEPDFAEGYAESFLNTYIAAQIKTIRQQRKMTQGDLAAALDTTQTVISRIENVNYAGWNIGTLKKLARAFDVRLKVSFEEYGTLPEEVETFSKDRLMRAKRTDDPRLREDVQAVAQMELAAHAASPAPLDSSPDDVPDHSFAQVGNSIADFFPDLGLTDFYPDLFVGSAREWNNIAEALGYGRYKSAAVYQPVPTTDITSGNLSNFVSGEVFRRHQERSKAPPRRYMGKVESIIPKEALSA